MREILSDGIVQTERVNRESTFFFVSYYWGKGKKNKNSIAGLTYDQQVERLIQDCKKARVNYYFVRYPQLEQGVSYQIALGLKPEFIEYCLQKLKGYKCIFVDTDLRLLKYPHLFDADMDCWFLNWNEYDYECYNPLQLELPGGVMGFANTHSSRTLLKILIAKLDKKYAEDKTFSGVITRNFLNVFMRCMWLPETYMYMFNEHEYTPGEGYTKIASYRQEFKDNYYKQSEVVITHEDFETGALEDVYNEKVGKSRWPPYVDKQLGEKLRCFHVKLLNYKNWALNAKQSKHITHDILLRQKAGLVKQATIPKRTDFAFPSCRQSATKTFYRHPNNPRIVSIVDRTTDANTIQTFISHCAQHRLNYTIYQVENVLKTNKPLFIYKIMEGQPVVYVDIQNSFLIKQNSELLQVRNMDFMTINLNALFEMSKCYDMRVLKTLNDNIMYFADNLVTRQFLLIWASFNTRHHIKSNLQHKSLEYAFNVSTAVNKLRCYWIAIKKTNMSKNQLQNFIRNYYTTRMKQTKMLTKSLEQCGVKPPRNKYSEPFHVHHRGSRGKRGINKFGKLFLDNITN